MLLSVSSTLDQLCCTSVCSFYIQSAVLYFCLFLLHSISCTVLLSFPSTLNQLCCISVCSFYTQSAVLLSVPSTLSQLCCCSSFSVFFFFFYTQSAVPLFFSFSSVISELCFDLPCTWGGTVAELARLQLFLQSLSNVDLIYQWDG